MLLPVPPLLPAFVFHAPCPVLFPHPPLPFSPFLPLQYPSPSLLSCVGCLPAEPGLSAGQSRLPGECHRTSAPGTAGQCCVCVSMCVCLCVCVCASVCMLCGVHTCAYVCVCMYVRVYVMCTCMHVCMCVHKSNFVLLLSPCPGCSKSVRLSLHNGSHYVHEGE